MGRAFLGFLAAIGLMIPVATSSAVASVSNPTYVVGQINKRDVSTNLDFGASLDVVVEPVEDQLGVRIAAHEPTHNPANPPGFVPVQLGPERGFGNNDCRGDLESDFHTGRGKSPFSKGGNDNERGRIFNDNVIVGNNNGKCVSL